MDAKTKEEIELLQELIDSPDTPQDEKELYRDTIKELKAEAEKSKPEPKVEKTKTEKKPATPKTSATKKEAPKKLPVDADKMKAEIKERTGKTEEECEVIIAEYRQLREKSKKIEAKRLGKLDDEGKLIAGTKEKTAAAVIETAAENIKDKLEKQVDKLEKEAEKGNPTQDQIEARINKNLGQLSKEMTKQATGFIKGIQSELAKADKTEAKQFLMNVRAEIDDLLSKFGGGGLLRDRGWLNDRRQVNQREDYEVRYEKKNNTGRTNYAKKKNSVGSTFGGGGGVGSEQISKDVDFLQKKGYSFDGEFYFQSGDDFIEVLQGTSLKDNKKVVVLFRTEEAISISREMLAKISSSFGKGDEIELFTNAGVDLHSSDKGKYKNITVKRLPMTFGGGGDVKWVIFNKEEDEAYESALEYYLNEGYSDLKAERLAISDLKKEFPRLKKELVGNYKISLGTSIASEFGGGGEVGLNSEIILTENRDGGSVVRAVVKPFMLESIEDNQYKGGFKRYEIDIYDEVDREPTKKELEDLNSFFDKVGGRFDIGGFVQTYNITQGNMSSSSVNPSQFGEGGPIPEYEGERFSQEEFDYRLNLAKHQIISDIMEGMVDPSKVNDFGDLGAFVDHNYYGGFIEDDYDHSEGFVFEMSVQDALNEWIEEGGIKRALENSGMFAVGGSVEDQISYADRRIDNLKELRSVSNEDMRENIDFQIEAIEKQKSRLLSGDLVPRKRLFGLF
jgi:uncharacterized protein YjbJ (UPF0337 family)